MTKGRTVSECYAIGPSITTRSHNRIVIKQLGFGVAKLDEAAERFVAHGGTVLAHAHQEFPEAIPLIVTDPHGIHLELVQRTA